MDVGEITQESLKGRTDVCVVVLPSLFFIGLVFVFLCFQFRVGEITQGRISINSRSPLSEPGHPEVYIIITPVFDVGEIHRRGDIFNQFSFSPL